MKIRAIFTEPPKPAHPAVRYGMLIVCLLLLAWHIQWRFSLLATYTHDRNGGAVVVLMLLFNLLAFQFHWPTSVTVALRALAFGWLAFGGFYIYYWSRIPYP